jgi:hypothetical protein
MMLGLWVLAYYFLPAHPMTTDYELLSIKYAGRVTECTGQAASHYLSLVNLPAIGQA